MYSPTYHYQDDETWEDVRAGEREEAQVELDLARAERQKLERQLQSLQGPDALIAKLAAERGESIEETRAQLDAIRAASKPATPTASPAPKALPGVDPEKLDALLDQVPAGDFNAAAQALLDSGATVIDPLGQHWRNEAPPTTASRATPEQVNEYLNGATSLADLESKLDRLGLLAGGAA
jgi:hypothetical protein